MRNSKAPTNRNSYISCVRDATSKGENPGVCDALRNSKPLKSDAMKATPNDSNMGDNMAMNTSMPLKRKKPNPITIPMERKYR
tara:strand:- start:408 stop:656 length:249 start_codon:yes stop_codon:yes gene_type:complete